MNGEMQTSTSGSRSTAGNLLLGCCPCFVDPCGPTRRSEYVKSLRSFSVLVGLLQVLMFIVSVSLKGFVSPSQNPMLGPPTESLVLLGAKQCYLIQQRYQLFRFLTPILLHAGIIHLVMNMICQWRFALFVERRWGTPRFAAVYLSAGFGATLLSLLWNPNKIAVGASGALMGIMGGFIADLILNWNTMQPFTRNTLLIQTATWSIIGLALGFVPFVDAGAHFGGWVFGLAASFVANSHIPSERRMRIMAMIVPAVLITIFIITGIACFWAVVKCTPYP